MPEWTLSFNATAEKTVSRSPVGVRLSPCSYWSVVNQTQTDALCQNGNGLIVALIELRIVVFRSLWVVFVCMLFTSGPISRPTTLLMH